VSGNIIGIFAKCILAPKGCPGSKKNNKINKKIKRK